MVQIITYYKFMVFTVIEQLSSNLIIMNL